ncbi:MAG: FAD:protein FMN transferase [Sinobacteraceae bacterium]|nr:FAD:protein FMN transferase [Nevskiaceae bacterium]MCP5360714.1 FAD:protein FMN transferase [Nevskiaceae bacterium]
MSYDESPASPAGVRTSPRSLPPPAPEAADTVQRAQPWLGTLVRIGVQGLDPAAAHAAIERGFAAIAAHHALMSFHDDRSELNRLNREAATRAVATDHRVLEVLRLALAMAEASDGVFDPTIAPRLVEWGFLPAPGAAPVPDPQANWRDIELDDDRVRFRRALWIDLGGIAKGDAVDAALAAMALPAEAQVCIDAGGDLRVAGPRPQRVVLNASAQQAAALPVLELTDGAVASSTGLPARRRHASRWIGPHLHGRYRQAVAVDRFASVAAPRCATADALTKIALAIDADAAAVCRQFAATAHVFSSDSGWRSFGRDA